MSIPRLRAAGYAVERIRRPMSRGTKWRVYRLRTGDTVAMCYAHRELTAVAGALLDGAPWPCIDGRHDVAMPGARASIVRPLARYL